MKRRWDPFDVGMIVFLSSFPILSIAAAFAIVWEVVS